MTLLLYDFIISACVEGSSPADLHSETPKYVQEIVTYKIEKKIGNTFNMYLEVCFFYTVYVKNNLCLTNIPEVS